ncbi:glycosyltransferase family 1 protein [Bacteroides sp. An51A]|uniref:glycosyltransferase family 4 protein n=1 Tax=Bacteroides sp. An51A TaxID=1965640 RepID=UPI000B38B398|nr:glycosyltransferase family 1 protein [Bacteroides sp. An51A]OUN78196.1 hypothetical protein B5G04_16205 [Bacteroides sp. An51A]
MKQYAINGRFVVRKQTGQERFAQEIVRELDKISAKGEFVLIIPQYAKKIPIYQNIEVVKFGNIKSHLWEQTNFLYYIKKHGLTSINLTTTCPLISPDIVCLHDACIFEISDLLTQNLYGKLSTFWHKLIFKVAGKKAKKILTVSNYSKDKLTHYLQVSPNKIVVIYNAWQHFNRVVEDNRIFSKLPTYIKRKEYFLALSSLTPQKNFIWIREVAKNNPQKQFVICGSAEGFTKLGERELKTDNLYFTGYLTDGEIKALMSNCRAFIHPAIYEGFGIPPLEAMSCGAELIISTATCLPEIYGKTAHYINPYNYSVNLDDILLHKTEPAKMTLEKYDWNREAKKLYSLLRTL